MNLSEMSLAFNFSNVVVAAVWLANLSLELFQVTLMMSSESVILSRLQIIEELRWSLLHLQQLPSVPDCNVCLQVTVKIVTNLMVTASFI